MKTERTISDEKIMQATGKVWDEWMSLLDSLDAFSMTHKEIVALIAKTGTDMWWQQSITVQYEQERGLRDKHQHADGFQVGATKTLPIPIEVLWNHVEDAALLAEWLPGVNWEVRKATPYKSMRITWEDGITHVDIYFWEKGEYKSMIQLNHRKLESRELAEAQKAYWKAAFARLKAQISG